MSDIYLTYFFLFILACLSSIPLWIYLRRKDADFFEPVYLSTAYFCLLFIVRPVFDLALGSDFIGPAPILDMPTAEAFNKGLLYLIPCFILFLVGYYSRAGRTAARALPEVPASWSIPKFRLYAPLFVLTGILSYYFLVAHFGGMNYYISNKQETLTAGGQGYYLAGLSLLFQVFIVGFTITLKDGKERFSTYAVMLPIVLVIGFLSGAKELFLLPVFSVLITINYLKKKVRPLVFVLIASVFMAVVVPVFNTYRHINDFFELQTKVEELVERTDPEKMARDSMGRFYGIDSVAIIIRDTPGVMDYQYGKTLLPVALFWIPRQIWSEKPVVSFGKVFGATYLHEWFFNTGTAASPTILGEAYINWHLAGMMLTALVFGVVLRASYEYLIINNRGGPAVFIFSCVFLYLFKFWEMDFSIFDNLFVSIASCALFIFLMGGKRREAQEEGHV